MSKFEIGKTYTHGWSGDSSLFTSWIVLERTAQTITIKCLDRTNEVRKCKINKQLSEYRNAETVRPFGSYSMSPLLSAK